MNRPSMGLFIFYLMLRSIAGEAQQTVHDSLLTKHLDPVTVTSEWIDPFVQSEQLKKIDLTQGELSLVDLLDNQSGIYLRSYGHHQLSTISMRGTSASQTQVLWNGIPVNSPTLGQTDFSTWPTWLISSMAVHQGNCGSLYGSGAVGGAILINESTSSDSLPHWATQLTQGSFGLRSAGLKASYQIGNWRFNSKVFYSQIDNDFTIRSPKLISEIRQPHAEVINRGWNQQVQYQKGKHQWKAEMMNSFNNREVQPGILALSLQNTLITQSFRSALNHQFIGEQWKSKSTIGYLTDQTIYNDSLITPSFTFTGLHRSNFYLGDRWLMQGGALFQHTEVNSVQLNNEAKQWISEPFVSAVYHVSPQAFITQTTRWQFVAGQSRLIPSAQFSWSTATSSVLSQYYLGWSTGYRYPTLNDRYWQPGGNKDLNPETSQQFEIGTQWAIQAWEFSINSFWTQIKDQIVWLPNESNLWSPVNFRETRNQGVDISISFNKEFNQWAYQSVWSGSWTSAQSLPDESFMPYVPMWQTDWPHQIVFQNWTMIIEPHFTSRRLTSIGGSEFDSLPSYFELDARLTYHTTSLIKSKKILITLKGNNITNTYYELQNSLAMPGINYEIQLTIQ